MLLEHLAEIRSRAEAALEADGLDSHSAVLQELLRHFDPDAQKVCNRRDVQTALEAARSFALADICRSGDLGKADRITIIAVDKLDHELSPASCNIFVSAHRRTQSAFNTAVDRAPDATHERMYLKLEAAALSIPESIAVSLDMRCPAAVATEQGKHAPSSLKHLSLPMIPMIERNIRKGLICNKRTDILYADIAA